MKSLPPISENRAMTLTLRPPRVVVLFRGGPQWKDWARLAIAATSRVWGGGGFAFVPFDVDGGVHPKVLELATRYDPDYVAVASHGIAEWNRIAPKLLNLPEGSDIDELQKMDPHDVHDQVALNAAKSVIEACNPLAMSISTDTPHWYRLSGNEPISDPFIAVPAGPTPTAWVAADDRWTGDVALWACARTGLSTPGPEPQQPADVDLLCWLILPTDPPEELARFSGLATGDTVTGKPTWFQAASPDVASMRNGLAKDNAVAIVGDTADDFALAVLLDRMLGFALWLTEATLADQFGKGWRPQSALEQRLRHQATLDTPVTSVSLTVERLSELLPAFAGLGRSVTIDGTPITRAYGRTWAVREPVVSRGGLTALLVEEHLGTTVATAVTRSEDDTIALDSTISSPLPENPRLTDSGNPAWLLDIAIDHNPMPPARRLPSSALVDQEPGDAVMLRSARDGLTLHAGAFGVVMSGTVLASRLARTRPRFLGMRRWVTAQAGRHDLQVRTSRPGVHADLLARRLGSRQRLREVANGPLLPVFRDLSKERPSAAQGRSANAYPDGDGVLLPGGRFLAMPGLTRMTPETDSVSRREAIDELLRTRLMRQGLVLDCDECATPAFIGLDDLGQTYTCARCGAENEFAGPRWRQPVDEPKWFYDLHPAARDLFRGHGEVSLLAAEQLRIGSRRYVDTSELEFIVPGADKPEYEIDLIAFSDDGVSVVEAKSNGSLGSGKDLDNTVRKRFRAAEAIDADRVVFARTAAPWAEATIDRVAAIQANDFPRIDLAWIGDLA